MTENEILDVLHAVQHPELQSDIVSLGMVDGVRIDEEGIRITIVFARARDPFAQAIRKRSEEAVASRYPQYAGKISSRRPHLRKKTKGRRSRWAPTTASAGSWPSVRPREA